KIFQKVDMEIHIDSSNDAIILVFNAGMRDSATVGFAISLPGIKIVYLNTAHRRIGVFLWRRSTLLRTIDQTSRIIPHLKVDTMVTRNSSRKGALRCRVLIFRRL